MLWNAGSLTLVCKMLWGWEANFMWGEHLFHTHIINQAVHVSFHMSLDAKFPLYHDVRKNSPAKM